MEAIRLQNFKGFQDSGWIALKPITLLFGYNSSGKSSIMQALLMLKQSLENPASEVPFVFSSEKGVDLGSYEDIVYNHRIDDENPITMSVKINTKDVISVLDDRPFPPDLNVDTQFEFSVTDDFEEVMKINAAMAQMRN